jgi:excisionase family DNA binding protein
MKATMRDAAPNAELIANALLLSVEESAAQLRIGRSRMFDLIRRGEVLSVKVGGSRRIPYDSLRAYVHKLVTEQASSAADEAEAAL